MADRLAFGGIAFTTDDTTTVLQRISQRQTSVSLVSTPNIQHVALAQIDEEFRSAINSCHIVVPDGWPVALGLRITRGRNSGRFAGSDLAMDLLPRLSELGLSLMIVGGSDQTLAAATRTVGLSYPDLQIKIPADNLTLPQRPSSESVAALVDVINEGRPDVVFLCMGAPKSELHIAIARQHLHPCTILCIGATVDFLAGTRRRAPRFVRAIGLEWAYRALHEPRRLLPRYATSAARFSRVLLAEFMAVGAERMRRRQRSREEQKTVFVTAAESPWGAEQSLALILAGRPAGPDTASEVICTSQAVADFLQKEAHIEARVIATQGGRLARFAALSVALLRLRGNLHVVIFSLYLAPVTVLLRLFRPRDVKVTLDIHDAPRSVTDRLATRLSARFSHRVIAISTYVTTALQLERYATVLPRPIDVPTTPTERVADETFRVGIVGRVDHEKRIELAIEMIARLPSDSHLHVFGAGHLANHAYIESLKRLAEARAPGRVTFHGRMSAAHIYSMIDALVVCNDHEPSGRSVGEAMAMGVPVVVPDAGGAPEYVTPDVTGIVYEPNDVGDLAARMCGLRDDLELRARLGKSGREAIAAERSTTVATGLYWQELQRG